MGVAGVALALMFAARAADEGRTRDYVLAGAAAGLAIAFKYTAGLVLLPLGIAAVARLRSDGARPLAGLASAARRRRSCSRCSTRTCSARSATGGLTCATRPT